MPILGKPCDAVMKDLLKFLQIGSLHPLYTGKRIVNARDDGIAMKLLIVEDEVRMADLLRKGLTEEGHMATCAEDGAEGLALAKAYEFDVIILDVMMPKLTGYELAKRLRAEKIGTPILMLT